MFSLSAHLRAYVRDLILAGVQDALEVIEQGASAHDVQAAAARLAARGLTPSQARPLSVTQPTMTTAAAPPETPAPPAPPTAPKPESVIVLPRHNDGYQHYPRRKRGRPPASPHTP